MSERERYWKGRVSGLQATIKRLVRTIDALDRTIADVRRLIIDIEHWSGLEATNSLGAPAALEKINAECRAVLTEADLTELQTKGEIRAPQFVKRKSTDDDPEAQEYAMIPENKPIPDSARELDIASRLDRARTKGRDSVRLSGSDISHLLAALRGARTERDELTAKADRYDWLLENSNEDPWWGERAVQVLEITEGELRAERAEKERLREAARYLVGSVGHSRDFMTPFDTPGAMVELSRLEALEQALEHVDLGAARGVSH